MLDFITIPAIIALCYLGAEVFKIFSSEDKYKHIPTFCALLGLILGVCCFLLLPGFIPAENAVVAAAIGAASGWAATGAYESYRQNNK